MKYVNWPVFQCLNRTLKIMKLELLIFGIIFIPLLILFLFINIKHNYINKDKKFEIIASPIYYILIFLSTVWFSYVLIIGLDPNF